MDGCLALVSNGGSPNAGFWFRDWSASGEKVQHHPDRVFGPVLCAMYTLSDGVLKLTAQMPPLGEADNRTATLQVLDGGAWRDSALSELIADSYTIPFRVEGWDGSHDTAYRIVYDLERGASQERFTYEGTIRAEPDHADRFVIAAFTGHKVFGGQLHWNHDGIWFPHADIVSAIAYHDPDLLFFSGDQIYEGDLTPITWRPDDRVILDYLYKWSRWCWSFRDLARDRPCITIPDDHDVYHGNIWGAGGVQAPPDPRFANAQDRGGYKMSTRFVNAVHRTQVSHLPDAVDPEPLASGISVYFTRLEYGGVSFAILADRMFKSAPAVVLPEAGIVNGWSRNAAYDPVTQGDAPDARLLGQRQLQFLDDWAVDFSRGAWVKVALSQTIFANVATLPNGANNGSVLPSLPITPRDVYPGEHVIVADHDSNGWPQSGRNRALRALRRGLALHIAGDQHLASTIRYGIDDWGDAGYALCVPSIANAWPRRWFPPEPGLNGAPGSPRYTGDYLDGFGNHMTVIAVANPYQTGHEPAALHDRAPGYGIIGLNRPQRTVTFEVWPRFIDPSEPDARPYPGWPVTLQPQDLADRDSGDYLPAVVIHGLKEPVVQVIDEAGEEMVLALRLPGSRCLLPFDREGTYTVRIGDPDRNMWRTLTGLKPVGQDAAVADERLVEFEPTR